MTIRSTTDFRHGMERLIRAIEQWQAQPLNPPAVIEPVRPLRQALVQLIRQLASAVHALLGERRARRVLAVLVTILVVLGPGLLLLSQTGGRSTGRGVSEPTSTLSSTATTGTQAATVAAARAALTATVNAYFTQPYVSPRPGPCDHGGTGWRLFENSPQFLGTISCTADSMQVDGNAVATFAGFANNTYPAQYRVSVEVTLGSSGCPGLDGQYGSEHYQYALTACANGTWMTQEDQGTIRKSGAIPAAAGHTLGLLLQNGVATFSLDGTHVDTIPFTGDRTTTVDIAIGQGPQGKCDFKSFVFTPLG